MSSPSQRRGGGGCGHIMAGFDPHSVCAHCRDKKKGSDPCVENPEKDCKLCLALTADQLNQLSTPSYKLKKEKRDAKSSTPVKDRSSDTLSPTLVDPALVSVVGVVDGQTTSGLSGPAEKKSKKSEVKKSSSSSSSKPTKPEKSVKPSSSRPPAASPNQGKSTTSTTDSRISELDKKWADRFNRLEALLAKTVDRPHDPTFGTVKVAPTPTPPANVVRSDPFLKPQSSLVTDRPLSTPLPRFLLHLSRNRPLLMRLRDSGIVPLTLPGRKLPHPVILMPTACHRTDQPWSFFRKRASSLRTKKLTCQIMINPSRRNNHIVKL